MLPYRDSRLTKIVLAVFFLIIAAYAYYEGRALLYGPSISIEGRVMQVSEPLITIGGEAKNIVALSMNGASVPVTEEGAFSEPYVLSPGYNRIVLEARDRYGKKTERAIEVVYTPGTASSSPAKTERASSTQVVAPSE